MTREWMEKYKDKITGAAEAISRIKPASRLFISGGCAEPRHLVNALVSQANALPDTEILGLLTSGKPPYVDPKYAESFRLNAFFVGNSMREAVWRGSADYTPVLLSEIPALFRSGRMHIDAALVQLSLPDKSGFCSLGISVDVAMAAIETADYVIAQLNPRMPRTHGDTFVPLSRLDAIVIHEEELLMPEGQFCDESCQAIAKNISSLIEDGSTLQIGMGPIPENVLLRLTDHKDLGVHTEMFSDSLMELIKKGVVTNRKKTLHKGKVIASFCMGSRDLYDFVDDNPMFEFHPSEYTNNRRVISGNDSLVAINTALQVDLTGQVCSDSLGYRIYSGLGGQVDFIRGAAMSKGGKPIIAIASTTDDGAKSTIVPSLEEGAGVVTTRGDVHYIVTEYGAAFLHGKSIRERAMSLIEIAHPKFKNWLLDEAKRHNFIYADQQLKSDAIYPAQYERWETFPDSLRVFFRPVKPTDEKELQRLIYRMSQESRYLRFFQNISRFPHRRAQELTMVDYSDEMALVGIVPKNQGEELIAAGQYMTNRRSGMAEVAFMIRDDYQGHKIGSFLLKYLIKIARENGVKGFTANVMPQNKAMMGVFLKCGYEVQIETSEADIGITFTFDKPVKVKGL